MTEGDRRYRLFPSSIRTNRGAPVSEVVGEIYLRSHPDSNQNIVRHIEQYGGEVVNASIGEWINFIAFDRDVKMRRQCKLLWKEGNHDALRQLCRQWLGIQVKRFYQSWRQAQVYRMVTGSSGHTAGSQHAHHRTRAGRRTVVQFFDRHGGRPEHRRRHGIRPPRLRRRG